MIIQYASLSLGLLMVGLNLYRYFCFHKRFWVTVFWVIFWGSYAGFYAWIILTDLPAHQLSQWVRLFRNGMLASWYILHKFGKKDA